MADSFALSYDGSQPNMVAYPLFLQAAGADPAISYTASAVRQLIDAIWPKDGTITPGDMLVTQRGAGANYSVDIAAGRAVITGSDVVHQGTFLTQSNGVVNIATPTPPVSGTRFHRLVAQLLDKQAAGTLYGWQYHLVTDTGSGLPAAPADSYTLATIALPAGAASVTNSIITNTSLAVGPARPYFSRANYNSSYVSSAGVTNLMSNNWAASDDIDGLFTAPGGGVPCYFTIPATGRWLVTANFNLDPGATSTFAAAGKLMRNGTADANTVVFGSCPVLIGTTGCALKVTDVVSLTAGDKIYGALWTSGALTVRSTFAAFPLYNTMMSVQFVGPQ